MLVDRPDFHKTQETFIPGSKTLERTFFTSPEIFEKDKEVFIYQNPICIGHVSDIPESGYFLYGIDNESLIVKRDEGGNVRAFHNTCPHRHYRIVEEPKGGSNKVLQCIYHGISFDDEGRVINGMALKETEGVDLTDVHLKESATHVWNGFIFVNLDPLKPMNFDEVFRALPDLDKYNLNDLQLGAEITYDVNANWKVIFDNYEECDHCPIKHPQLVRVSGYKSWFNDLTEGPVLGGYMHLKDEFEDLTMSGELVAPFLGNLNANEKRRIYNYSFAPGMLLLGVHPDYVNYDIVKPIGPDRTQVISRWLFRPEAFKNPNFNPRDAVDFWNLTNEQDFYDICPKVQLGESSRFTTPGPLSSRESLVAAFDRHYLRTISPLLSK